MDIGGEDTVFRRGLSVVTTVDEKVQKDVMRDIDIADIQAPTLLIRNIEKLAIQINEQYIETTMAGYNDKKEKGLEISDNLKKKVQNVQKHII